VAVVDEPCALRAGYDSTQRRQSRRERSRDLAPITVNKNWEN